MKQVCEWFAANSTLLDARGLISPNSPRSHQAYIFATTTDVISTPRPHQKSYFGFSPVIKSPSPILAPSPPPLPCKTPLHFHPAKSSSMSSIELPVSIPALKLASHSSPASSPSSAQTSPLSSPKKPRSFISTVIRRKLTSVSSPSSSHDTEALVSYIDVTPVIGFIDLPRKKRYQGKKRTKSSHC